MWFEKSLCRLRATAFWILDFAKGGRVRKAYQDLTYLDSIDADSPLITEYQRAALQNLLEHAVTTTSFYSDYHGDSRLDSFPVVDKSIIRNRQDEFISRSYKKSRLIKMSTSGSTGTPFICYQNIGKKRRVNAEVIYYSEKAGYSVGTSLIYLRAVPTQYRKSKFVQWVQNQSLIDIGNLGDESIEKTLKTIDRASRAGAMLLAYASTYDALKDYLLRKGVKCVDNSRIHGIVSSSEMLLDDTRNAMEDIFGCTCYSRYSNQENGIMGQDDEQNNVFVLNEAHYVVEIFELDEDVPAKEGTVGRIVITDLYNYAMPMIRYDTGDIGALTYIKIGDQRKKAISEFGGRKTDIVFDSYGNRLSPHIIGNNLASFQGLKQYQFIQENSTKYTIRINASDSFDQEEELKVLLTGLLGSKAEITIETVDEIPVLASGKRRFIINKCN